MQLIHDLKARGMLYQISNGAEDFLASGSRKIYLGIDPTADSLHVGHLVPILMLAHFQAKGHKPLLLIGGATGRIGDPSGRSEERNLLPIETLEKNVAALKVQVGNFLRFEGENAAQLLDNFSWFKQINFLDFTRDIGKHITINYMLNKESVGKRMESERGISFTEFTYQLIQGYDFLHLFQTHDCAVQIGGSDQWGNMLTGIELIRRKCNCESFVLTTPLLTRSNGEKFGKSSQGTVWLDRNKTSPFAFYQFWINISDEEASRFIKIFSFLTLTQIEELIARHQAQTHLRVLQKELAYEITKLVHGKDEANWCAHYSSELFQGQDLDFLERLNPQKIQNIFSALPKQILNLPPPISLLELLVDTNLSASKSEARRQIQSNSIFVNKQRINDPNAQIELKDFFDNKYLIIQVGKKNFNLIELQGK